MSEPAVNDHGTIFYSPRQVGALTGLHYETVLKQIKDGSIPSVSVGRLHKVPAYWVTEQAGQPKTELRIVPAAPADQPKPDYTAMATVMDVLGRALVTAAAELRGGAA